MEADAALGRAPDEVVLDPVALEHPDRPIIHLHGEVDDQLALRLPQKRADAWVEIEEVRCGIELPLRVEPGIIDPWRSFYHRHCHDLDLQRSSESHVECGRCSALLIDLASHGIVYHSPTTDASIDSAIPHLGQTTQV